MLPNKVVIIEWDEDGHGGRSPAHEGVVPSPSSDDSYDESSDLSDSEGGFWGCSAVVDSPNHGGNDWLWQGELPVLSGYTLSVSESTQAMYQKGGGFVRIAQSKQESK